MSELNVLWRWTFQGSVLIVMVLILRLLLLDRVPKRTFTVLWTVCAARLLLPFFLDAPRVGLARTLRLVDLDLEAAGGRAMLSAVDRAMDTGLGSAAERLAWRLRDWQGIWFDGWAVLWLGGVLACALVFVIRHLRGRRVYAESLPAEDPFVAQWMAEHPVGRAVQVRVSDRVDAPLTYGVFRPVVLLPRTTDWEDHEALGYVLAHELHHVRRYDTLRKWAFAAAACIHWFNPLAWVMVLAADHDLELDCDEDAAQAVEGGSRSGYARTLIAMEERRSPELPFAGYFSRSALEGRIRALMTNKRCGLAHLAAAVLAVWALASVCGGSFSAAVAVDEVTYSSVAPVQSLPPESIGVVEEGTAYCAAEPVQSPMVTIAEADEISEYVSGAVWEIG